MEPTARIEGLIAPSLEALGFRVVQVRFIGVGGATLQVMAEPVEEHKMTVDDCAKISRTVSALLDVEDPIVGSYVLEVSSPGLDRPLVRLADFERFAGREAKIELAALRDGRKRFRGRLAGVSNGHVILEADGRRETAPAAGERKVYELPFDQIANANLVVTDAVIQAALVQRSDS